MENRPQGSVPEAGEASSGESASTGEPRKAPSGAEPDEELELDDDESMIHRLDFGLHAGPPKSAAPAGEAAAAGPPREQPEAADVEGIGMEEQLELEDRFDWAFQRGQHFAEPPRQAVGELPPPSALEPLPSEAPAPPIEPALELEPTRLLEPKPTRQAPPSAPAAASRPKVQRKPRKPARGKAVPRWFTGALAVVLVAAGVAVWVLLGALSEEAGSEPETPELPGRAAGPLPGGDAGPGIEVHGLDVVAGQEQPAARAPAEPGEKLVLGSGGEPVAGLRVEPPQPAATAGPEAGAAAAAGPEPGDPRGTAAGRSEATPAVKRAWEPLLTGPEMPGWQSRGQEGWSVRDGVLTLRSPPGRDKLTALVTERTFRNLALTFKAQPADTGTTFGVLARARSGAGLRLEFTIEGGKLRAGDRSVPVPWSWKPGQWHQVALVASGPDVLVYVDRRKLATMSDAALEGEGRLGVYCMEGQAAFRSIYVQSLDAPAEAP
jgi:hypothetical protein